MTKRHEYPSSDTKPLFVETEEGDVIVDPELVDKFGWEDVSGHHESKVGKGSHKPATVPLSTWTEQRNPHLFDAMDALNQSNMRKGAGLMTDGHPVANKLDREYVGGRVGVANRSEEFHNVFRNELLIACGVCALRATCLGVDNPSAFEKKYAKSTSRNKFKKALDKKPDMQC